MIYLVVVVVLASTVAALMSYFLLPMFADLLKDIAGRSGRGFAAAEPHPFGAFSAFMKSAGWLVFPVVLIGTPIALLTVYRTKPGKAVMDRMLLWVPVFGPLVSKIDTSRFARTLSASLNAGVDIGTSLELSSDVLHLDPYRLAIRNVRTPGHPGDELSEALSGTRRFGPDVIAVVNSGEETGKLPETLNHLADDYEEQVAYMVKNMGQLVQPLVMVMMGALVLFIILAVSPAVPVDPHEPVEPELSDSPADDADEYFAPLDHGVLPVSEPVTVGDPPASTAPIGGFRCFDSPWSQFWPSSVRRLRRHAGGWKAGVAKAAITPKTPVWMAGYGSRNHPSEGAVHDLWAKGLGLEDPTGKRALIITLDVCGIDGALSRRVRDGFKTELGLDADRVGGYIASLLTHALRPGRRRKPADDVPAE